MTRFCTYQGCGRAHYARGLCRAHHYRARNLGYFEPRYQPSLFPLAPAFALTGMNVPGFLRFHGVSTKRFATWQRIGLTTFEADQVALRIGRTPDGIWSNWYTAAADEVLDEDFDAPLILERTS